MNRTQKYISLLLERLPKYELRSYEHQTSLDRIRDRISSTEDIHAELRALYQVQGFAEFALCLMWVADKVEKDFTKEESTIDEETKAFTRFRQAVGDLSASEQEPTVSGSMFDMSGSEGFGSAPAPVTDFNPTPSSEFESPSVPGPSIDSIFGSPEPPSGQSMPAGGASISRPEQEHKFAVLLEKFLESVQSGNEDRTDLLFDVIAECNTVLSANFGDEDYSQFCRSLIEFLQYISTNQYLDDVRVMNILSNIQDPFAQWARTDMNARAGILVTVNDTLRDFKAMFE
ncbi:MAG: hypothetical protein EHM64_04785 [Ignavibacteriae bacterium]|nr:MAG: hypothetical protein EHM64_04785 [Ignavibacteriota bacterium]